MIESLLTVSIAWLLSGGAALAGPSPAPEASPQAVVAKFGKYLTPTGVASKSPMPMKSMVPGAVASKSPMPMASSKSGFKNGLQPKAMPSMNAQKSDIRPSPAPSPSPGH